MTSNERLGPIVTHIVIDKYIDSNNHLNNAAWGLHLETGRLQTAFEFGIGMQIPLQQTSIRYRKQIMRGDEIDIITFVVKDNDSVDFNQSMQRGEETAGISSSKYGFSIIDMGQPIQPLSEIKLRLEQVFPLKEAALHHLTALYYYEEARKRFLEEREFDMARIRREQGISFMVATLEAKYIQDMHQGEDVIIRTGFDHYRSQFKFHQEMIKDGQILNKAETMCALVDQEGTLIRSPEIIDPIKNRLVNNSAI